MHLSLKNPLFLFSGLIVTFFIIAIWAINSEAFLLNTALLSGALTIDLTILLPAVYLYLAYKNGWRKLNIIPLFGLSILVAGYILPAGGQFLLNKIAYLLFPIEFFIFGFVIYKIRQARSAINQSRQTQFDQLEAIKSALLELTGSERISKMMATEIAMFYYAFQGTFSGINSRMELPENYTAFTYHKKSGVVAILFALIMASVVEMAGVHFLLAQWSTIGAWVATILTFYGMIFFFGLIQSVKNRPIYFDDQFLIIRTGFIWTAKIPLNQIESIHQLKKGLNKKVKNTLNVALLSEANILITMKTRGEATGLYGLKKSFKYLGVNIDTPAVFLSQFN